MMTNNDRAAPTRAFRVIGSLALAWNLMGVAAFYLQMSMTPEALADMSAEVRALYEVTPSWVNAAYAVAVFGGTAACIALLLRKTSAVPLFAVSLLGVLAQMGYTLLVADTLAVMGVQVVTMPLVIVAVGIYLLLFSRNAAKRGVLR